MGTPAPKVVTSVIRRDDVRHFPCRPRPCNVSGGHDRYEQDPSPAQRPETEQSTGYRMAVSTFEDGLTGSPPAEALIRLQRVTKSYDTSRACSPRFVMSTVASAQARSLALSAERAAASQRLQTSLPG